MQSYNEQQAGFRIACDKMNKYLGTSLTMVKSFCIVGGPGAGKNCTDEDDFIRSHITRIEWYVINPHARMGLPARWYPLAQATSVAGP
jgi:hypothetical protein